MFDELAEKSMTVCNNTAQAEGLSMFFKKVGKTSAKAGKMLLTKIKKNPERTLEMGARTGSLATSKNSKAALPTTSDVIYFYHTGKGKNFGKIV